MRAIFQSMIAFLAMAVVGVAVNAHEIDHYALPVGKELVDLGGYWNRMFYEAVRDGVANLNREIAIARHIPVGPLRESQLKWLHSAGTVAARVRSELPPAWWAIETMELHLLKERLTGPQLADGKLWYYRSALWETTYGHMPIVPDPRYIYRLTFARSSLVNIHGTYMGTDKLGHFIGVGYLYFQAYRTAKAAGRSSEDATQDAMQFGTWGPLGERSGLGILPTGVCSNADMVANYTGMKFFINLTEPVRLKGVDCPPMLIRDGDFWGLADHVTADGPFFSFYVSDHLDEALNPSTFDPTIRPLFHRRAKQHAAELVDWYAGDDPDKQCREYFDGITESLRTYYGEEYGRAGDDDAILTLGEICFPESRVAKRESEPPSRKNPLVFVSWWE